MTTLTATTDVQTSSGDLTFRHAAWVKVSTNNSAAWVTCVECGRGDYANRFGGKSHKSYCDHRGETGYTYGDTAKVAAKATAVGSDESLRAAGHTFADADELVTAVRTGCVSMSAAMNRDF